MLRWTITFIAIAIMAAILGFTGIVTGAAAVIAKILAVIFIILFILSLNSREKGFE